MTEQSDLDRSPGYTHSQTGVLVLALLSLPAFVCLSLGISGIWQVYPLAGMFLVIMARHILSNAMLSKNLLMSADATIAGIWCRNERRTCKRRIMWTSNRSKTPYFEMPMSHFP